MHAFSYQPTPIFLNLPVGMSETAGGVLFFFLFFFRFLCSHLGIELGKAYRTSFLLFFNSGMLFPFPQRVNLDDVARIWTS